MKVNLINKNSEPSSAYQGRMLDSLLRFFLNSSVTKKSRPDHFKSGDSKTENLEDKILLHVDFNKSLNSIRPDRSSDIEIVIYLGEESEFSHHSIPCITFSLDNLIDEKIEMLDASVISQNKVEILERLTLRLDEHSKQLRDALRRYYRQKKSESGKNSPLW